MEISPFPFSSAAPTSKGEDPWDEGIQSGCLKDRAGESPPFTFKTERELYRILRNIWALDLPLNPLLARHPFVKSFPLSQILVRWLGGTSSQAPFVPAGFDQMLVSELCQYALFLPLAGFWEEGWELASSLLPFAEEKPFFSLCCPEEDYDESEISLSFSLLLRAFEELPSYPKDATSSGTPHYPKDATSSGTPYYPKDATSSGTPHFFLKLAEKSPLFKKPLTQPPHKIASFFRNKNMRVAFASRGEKTSIGMIQCPNVEIRAMGPQSLPLSEPNRFGIRGGDTPDWIQCFDQPEVWFHLKTEVQENSCQLGLRFFGIHPERPLAFVFYIQAAHSFIGSQVYKPKSLQRYSGEARSFLFDGSVQLESGEMSRSELIPLAGERGFWGADFLLSFEISPYNPEARFIIRCL